MSSYQYYNPNVQYSETSRPAELERADSIVNMINTQRRFAGEYPLSRLQIKNYLDELEMKRAELNRLRGSGVLDSLVNLLPFLGAIL